MSDLVALDPGDMEEASGHVRGLFDTAVGVSGKLRRLGAGVDMPPPVAAHVEQTLGRAARALVLHVPGLQFLAEDILRRAGDARAADRVTAVGNGVLAEAGLATGAAKLGVDHPQTPLPANAAKAVKTLGKALKVAGPLGGAGAKLAGDFTNPYLTPDQRAKRAAKAAASSGAGALSAMAAGAVAGSFAGPPGAFLGSAAAGVTWMIADNELGLSDGISDAIDGAADDLADTAEAFEAGFEGFVDGIKGGPDPVAKGVGTVKDVLGL